MVKVPPVHFRVPRLDAQYLILNCHSSWDTVARGQVVGFLPWYRELGLISSFCCWSPGLLAVFGE